MRLFLERIGATSSPARDPAQFEAEFNRRIERASTPEQLPAVWNWAKNLTPQPLSCLFRLSRKFGDYD